MSTSLKYFIYLVFFAMAQNANAEVVWKVSSARTNVKFKVKHFVLMEVEGKFKNPKGLVTTNAESDFSNANVLATIPVATVSTGNQDRDAHLKQAVFFNADKYPEMIFKSSKVVKKNDQHYTMLGNLTIRGVTHKIAFDVVHDASKVSADGKMRSKFVAKGSLNRYDYGLKWNELTEAGSMVVGEKVDIEMDVTLEKDPTSLAATLNSNSLKN